MKFIKNIFFAMCVLVGSLSAQTMDTTIVKVPYKDSIKVISSIDTITSLSDVDTVQTIVKVDTVWNVSVDSTWISRIDTLFTDSIFYSYKDSLIITPKPILASNEPAGYSVIAELFGDRSPPCCSAGSFGSVVGSIGNWATNKTTKISMGPPSALIITYNAAAVAGVAPILIEGWTGQYSSPPKYRNLYYKNVVKIGGANGFENQAVGTKFGFISYAQPTYTARNQGFFFLKNGTGVQKVQTQMRLDFVQQGLVDRTLPPNKATGILTTGIWHTIEAVFILNTVPGTANGILKIWIDGKLTHSYTNVVYTTPGAANPFQWLNWNPTWGGTGGIRTRTDTVLVDHIRISGTP